ncbi:DUF6056 family protein [Butyrivibrio sp. INlla21]|uniref:DUF6056 family protein n=1 Tax=Butyrivibrio sp. INlla21 TaxID=1520811 RepID=UPI0008E5DE60|nr:DUF6056 family protein [Butyrivibrio sp. INlla21]SFV00740.1 hypothetical protein SAMN02910342_02911 [Butyrivibrio sp. INlla21]
MDRFFRRNGRLLLLTIFCICSLIPIFVMAKYDFASGDDYNYGALSHQVFLNTGSVWEAIIAAVKTVVSTWFSWQGTWFDCFVFCLHPEVFSDKGYMLVPYIFLIMQIVSFGVFGHHFLKRRWNLPYMCWIEVTLLFLMFMFQLVPSQKSAFFWWVGCVHYAMPMCMVLIGIVEGDKFLTDHKIKDIIGLTFIAALLGGATYPAALLLPIVLIVLFLKEIVIDKHRDSRNWLLLVPFIFELVGLVVSMIAPGNAVRSAADISEGAIPSGGIFLTIIKSITYSVSDATEFFIAEKSFIIIAVILVGILVKKPLVDLKNEDNNVFKHRFSHPFLFLVISIFINAAMYAPRLYAGNSVSSGYFNFNFEVFMVCVIACTIYVEGWIIGKEIFIGTNKKRAVISYVIVAILIMVIAYVGRHGVKEYTDYVCMKYYLSGQADDYLEQMKLQRRLMTEVGVDDVVVPMINYDQGPLMHMPITEDPENIVNTMTAAYYGKKSCRSISREEWIELYQK